ncbi:Hypothetical predicted protein [Mytilus galloprovincialis]|uniref:Tyr recombinase domain-containing protein n=1 Tax=Mytilus galloprovincialis TaxID=29158 RepID=A0A8B6GYL7_MYTGA|nr:Hypothetical predicted protein [Mytilus galloprovincialis]
MRQEKSIGTLIVPYWRSAPFWPILNVGIEGSQTFACFVGDSRVLSSSVVIRGRGKNGLFGKTDTNFRIGLKCTIQKEISQCGAISENFTQLVGKMEELHSHSSNTNSKYFYSFKRWEQFISKEGGKSIPASPIHVALYLTHLLDKGSSKSVVQSAVYGIKWAHNIQGIQDPTTNSFVVNLMEAAKRQPHRPRVKKDHITVDVLKNLCSKYKDCNDLLVIRDLTMIILCFAGFLRYDEISSIRCKDIVFKSVCTAKCIF